MAKDGVMSEHVVIGVEERVLEIRMARLEKKNALTSDMYAAMVQGLKRAVAEPEIRAVLISGAPDCFTAGNDIADFLAHPPLRDESPVLQFLHLMATLDKPVVAAVGGIATGIGTTMLLHCDVVVAAANARFHTPFVELGLVPEAGSSLLLPLLVGQRKAARMLMLSEALCANDALDFGIVTYVIDDPEQLLEEGRRYAQTLAAKAPAALQATKRLMRAGIAALLAEQMAAEVKLFAERLSSAEAREAFAAFLNKRQPAAK